MVSRFHRSRLTDCHSRLTLRLLLQRAGISCPRVGVGKQSEGCWSPVLLVDKLAPLGIINKNVSPESYDALTGGYEFGGPIITISRCGAHQLCQFGDEPEAEIFSKSKTEFFWKGGEDFIPIMFVQGSSGKAVKLIFNDYDMKFAAPRAKDKAEAKVENSFAIR